VSALKVCPQCGAEYELDVRFCPSDGSTLKAQNTAGDLLGQIIADRYHVLKKLGEGGMGQVYLAEHVKMGRKSAVKVMHPGMVHDADAISRFNREAANASRINHPNVAAIYDFGETSDGLIYLAMEFIEGEALTDVIERLGALPPVRVADITRQAAEALGVACDMGIVHRDLKPDNIMIARTREGNDLVKVVDFGIAKATQSDAQKVTKTGLVVGTPEYMSPEQLAGDKIDGRSDIYSLALVAFTMFTGKLPFPSETVQESMIMRLVEQPRTLSQMKGDVQWPERLQAVMDRALSRDANSRYQSAPDFGRDLVLAVQSMPGQDASEQGTMVMGAPLVPPTRVARASTAGATVKMDQVVPGAGATVAIDAAAAGRSAPVAARSRTPIIAVAAVALIAVLGVGGYMMTRPDAAAGVPGDASSIADANAGGAGSELDSLTAGTGTQGAAGDTPAGSNPQTSAQTQQPQQAARPTGNPTGTQADPPRVEPNRGTTVPPVTAPTFENVEGEIAELRRLWELALTGNIGDEQVRSLVSNGTSLLGRNIAPDVRLQARFFRAFGRLLQNDQRGCTELAEIDRDAVGMWIHEHIRNYRGSQLCTPELPFSSTFDPASATFSSHDLHDPTIHS
jgi:eukaryotic-like serine/threonine-protein kinase